MEKLTEGRLKIELFPPNTFCAPAETLPTLAGGVVDAMISVGPFYMGSFPLGEAEMGVPWGWINHAEVWEAHYEMGVDEVLKEAYAKEGVFYAAPAPSDQYYHFCTTFTMTSLDDIKGKKIRAHGVWGKYVAALGASIVQIPGPEMYMAMKLGTIDGAIYGMAGQMDENLAEVTKTYAFPSSGTPVASILVSMKSYNALPDDIKKIIENGSRYVMMYSAYDYFQFDEESWVYAQKMGVKKYQLTDAEILRAVQLSQPVWDEVATKTPESAKIVAAIKELSRKYGRL